MKQGWAPPPFSRSLPEASPRLPEASARLPRKPCGRLTDRGSGREGRERGRKGCEGDEHERSGGCHFPGLVGLPVSGELFGSQIL